jgi:hydantoinase/carbamoylase family amidase
VAAPQRGFGARAIELAERLAAWSETPDGLTCTFSSPAHRRVAEELAGWMSAAGMTTHIDAVGNVVGRYAAATPGAKTLLVGSHYDTVVDAGKFDGRLGILIPLVAIEHLHQENRRLPFDLELIGFSEEEGVRFGAPYIGSSAIAGAFDNRLLSRRDAAGLALGDVLAEAGQDPAAIPLLARARQDLLGYLEVHIEQGPVLLQDNLALGVVTGIAGAVRCIVSIEGEAGHAGTVPMPLRRDALAAAAEIVLAVERHCAGAPALVGTVGQLNVPRSAMNTIPGRCDLSLDLRSPDDATRDAALAALRAETEAIAQRRCVTAAWREIQRTPAVACARSMQDRLAAAVLRAGIRPCFLPSGAGHDAVSFAGLTEIGMLFVRCGNNGVSHSPRETVTVADADIAAQVFLDVLNNFGP